MYFQLSTENIDESKNHLRERTLRDLPPIAAHLNEEYLEYVFGPRSRPLSTPDPTPHICQVFCLDKQDLVFTTQAFWLAAICSSLMVFLIVFALQQDSL